MKVLKYRNALLLHYFTEVLKTNCLIVLGLHSKLLITGYSLVVVHN